MGRRKLPIVSENYLMVFGEGQSASILIESEDWYQWLTNEQNHSFAFHHPLGAFIARRERKGAGWYWYAYRKHNGKLHKAYLGKSQEVTLQRLSTAATILTSPDTSDEMVGIDSSIDDAQFSQQSMSTLEREGEDDLAAHKRGTSTKTIISLPTYLTPLLGREQEVTTVSSLLQRSDVRIVTLTGPGGIGKTRLGVQIATQLATSFNDGVYFVPLAPLHNPELVLAAIAQILGIRGTNNWSLTEHLKIYLQTRQLLLLIDNLEHLLHAIPQLIELLTGCPGIKMLVTSRAVLRARGEHVFQVSPLALPDLHHLPAYESVLHYAAIELFLQRVWSLKPNFQLTPANARSIAEICIKLEGLPLALELAAARIKLLSLQTLLERLEQRLHLLTYGASDAPERQQTLYNTIRWSYELLSPPEQRLFRRVSIFMGGFTVEAAEYLYQALDASPSNVLDVLTSLHDKSLLQLVEQGEDEPRLSMLEMIREYGLECLATSSEIEASSYAHVAYYLTLAEQAAQHWATAEEQAWRERLEREHDNLRMAMTFLLEHRKARENREMALRLGATLWWFWNSSMSHQHEGWSLLEKALEDSESVAAPIRTKALWATGNLAAFLGHFERAEALCQQSLTLSQETGDIAGVSNAVFHLGVVADFRGDFTAARSWFKESLVLSRELSNKVNIAYALVFLAQLANTQGEYAKVGPFADESMALFREMGNQIGMAYALKEVAKAMFFQGNLRRAHALTEECLTLEKQIDDKVQEAELLVLLGEVTLQQGDPHTAHLLLEKSVALLRQVRWLWQPRDEEQQMAWILSRLGKVLAIQGNYQAARALYEESLESLLRVQAVNSNLPFVDLAFALEGLATVVAAQGELAWAARLWGIAEAQRETQGTALPPVYRGDYEHSVTAARARFGTESFAVAWAEGRTMTYEQALALYRTPNQPIAAPLQAVSVPSPNELSKRELEVLRLVTLGLTDPQIAAQLILSPRTVSWYLSSIYRKIGVSSRSAATRYAIQHHLV